MSFAVRLKFPAVISLFLKLRAVMSTFCPVISFLFSISSAFMLILFPFIFSLSRFSEAISTFFDITSFISAFPFIFILILSSESTLDLRFTPTPFSVDMIFICPFE